MSTAALIIAVVALLVSLLALLISYSGQHARHRFVGHTGNGKPMTDKPASE